MTIGAQANAKTDGPGPVTCCHTIGGRENGAAVGDRRESTRQPVSGPIWWKAQDGDRFQRGWLIERSPNGAAFLTRGPRTPLQGMKVQVSTSDLTDVGFRIEEGLVTRTQHVHADLFLVATLTRLAGP